MLLHNIADHAQGCASVGCQVAVLFEGDGVIGHGQVSSYFIAVTIVTRRK